MARIKTKQGAPKTLSCKFGGMGKYAPLSPLGAEEVRNFRILPNGGMRVRSGYILKKHFIGNQPVRGVWEGTLGASSLLFAVAGNTIYLLSGDEMTETAVGTVSADTSSAHFFVHEDVLYLLDGSNIYTYSPASKKFAVIEPYVPLYGYAWSPTSYGEINEEINLLTPRLRVHYYNTDGATEFKLPYHADSIEVVRANGQKISGYGFSPGSNKITVSSAPIVLEVGLTVALNEELRAAILATQMSFIYSRNGNNRLMLWGNDARLFFAKDVTTPMLSSCQVYYPKVSPLYFCKDDVFFLGDSTHPVTALCPLYETLLAFTSDRIWNISFDKDGIIQATLAMHDMGCSSPKGVIPYDGGALVAMRGSIYHLTASSARPEDLSLERISAGVEDRFPAEFTEGGVEMIRNFGDGEVWIHNPTCPSAAVWVWNTESKEWYTFTAIDATLFFKIMGKIGFAYGSDIFLFDRQENTDNGSPIDAYYKSAYFDFGAPDSIRRSMRALLYASPNKSSSMVQFETEQEGVTYHLTSPSGKAVPQLHDIRMPTRRYRFLRFSITTASAEATEFYKLDLYSRP